MGLKKEEARIVPKRTLVIEQMPDDKIVCTFLGLQARQQLLPLLRAADKQFRVEVNRTAIKLSNDSGKLIEQKS